MASTPVSSKYKHRIDLKAKVNSCKQSLSDSESYDPCEHTQFREVFGTLLREYQNRVVDLEEIDFITSVGRAYHVSSITEREMHALNTKSLDIQRHFRAVLTAVIALIDEWCLVRLGSSAAQYNNSYALRLTLDQHINRFFDHRRPSLGGLSDFRSSNGVFVSNNISQDRMRTRRSAEITDRTVLTGSAGSQSTPKSALMSHNNDATPQTQAMTADNEVPPSIPIMKTVRTTSQGTSKRNLEADPTSWSEPGPVTKAARVAQKPKSQTESWSDFFERASPECFLSHTLDSMTVSSGNSDDANSAAQVEPFLSAVSTFMDGIHYDSDDEREGRPCSIPLGTSPKEIQERIRNGILDAARESEVTEGKWIFSVRHEHVHTAWRSVAEKVLNSTLSYKAEVFMGSKPGHDHEIAVYTKNFDDHRDRGRVGKMLSHLDLGRFSRRPSAYYTATAFTLLNIQRSTNGYYYVKWREAEILI